MANLSLQRRVIDEANLPVAIQNLLIEVYDHDVVKADDFLGAAPTDTSGSYGVSCIPRSDGQEANPALTVRVFDSVKSLAYESSVQNNVAASTFDFPGIALERTHAEGWPVAHGTGKASSVDVKTKVIVATFANVTGSNFALDNFRPDPGNHYMARHREQQLGE